MRANRSFNTSRQLKRYETDMKLRNFRELAVWFLKIALIVIVFVALCDICYRLSFSL